MSSLQQEVEVLADLAREQGWSVEPTKRGHLAFKSPDGKLVHVGNHPSSAHAVWNARSNLRQAGLDVPHGNAGKRKAAVEEEETVQESEQRDVELPSTGGPTMDLATLSAALDASHAMLEEFAAEFAKARRELRDQYGLLAQRVTTLEADAVRLLRELGKDHQHDEYVTAAMLNREVKALRSALTEAERKADPIGAFRARLQA